MEKLLGFYDTLNKLNTNSQFNVLLIIPVITVFFGAILVFVCGFRKAEEPKFKKISDGMNNSNSSKSKTKKKTNTNNNVNNQNGNIIQKPNSNEAILLKKLNSNTIKKQQQNKPGGVSSSSTSTQQMATSTNSSNKKNENDSKKDSSSLKKSSNQQQAIIQNSSKTVSNKKLIADNTLKNHKEELILNNKINKKSKSNTNKNQTLEGDGWQTVQSRTDKKNKKTENETSSSQSPTNVVQQLNAIGIIVPGNLTPKSPRKKSNDIKNKQISVSTTNTTTIDLKTSSVKDNSTDNNKLTESVDIENNKNLDNVIDNNTKSTTVNKQQTNQFSLPTYMTKEEFHEFVTRNSTATVLSNDTDSTANDTEKMSPITIDYKSISHSNEIEIAADDNKLTYHLQNKISSDVNQLDTLLDSSSVKQKQSNEKSSATTKNAALSFIENEKLISELESKTNQNVAFDELGDAWTETKTQKKNKKRVRKE